ncbi:hypothetical protein J2Y45_002925 [Dyadobacter sp. BE34]|uniref:Peptidase S74 domain-containing protein n=1 Tax=Dyadobacter fermentans TaxID=94254 RepID=A0ABU1QUU2_9BACT|nr:MULTISPECIES: tail fiber domain-containing protein [Dyadobacter]MDR6804767.1 hypothetical protein [Dyadobacter fermentans]MDR7043474.1 hypothetical protein [Dyadobacter sp. BE242]MDR7197786.1 hypothetical protein [Dyadobacter sp. BE34]MDR7214781.1 hypothetical protein [Dyadobacter sp. BE31]MDR7262316.1 hypothetical protein [Dyadobacter sp. BE32]
MQVRQLLTRTAGALGVTAGLLFVGSPLMAQVKIGDNPNSINGSSILELESTSKGLLLPRVPLTSLGTAAPVTNAVEGMHVFNTTTNSELQQGEYYWDGNAWVRLVTAVPVGKEVYREGAPTVGGSCGSDPEGTIWNDISEASDGSISGDRYLCKGGVWAVYTGATSSTPFFLGATSNTVDAGGAKGGTISRIGHIIARRSDNGGSTTIVPGGGLRLLRTLALAPVQGPYIDFGRNAANPNLFRISLRNDLNAGLGALAFNTNTGGNLSARMVIGLNGQVGVNVTDPKRLMHVNGQLLLAAPNQDGENFSDASGSMAGLRLYFEESQNRAQLFIHTNPSDPNVVLTKIGTTPNESPFMAFRIPAGQVGSIERAAGLTVFYNNASDRRLKENIKNTRYSIEDLMKIGVVDYNYISDEAKTRTTGFIAQDLYKVYPEAVSKGNEDVKVKAWMVDYSKLTPLLVKAVQDQQKEIAALKAQLSEMNALKAEVAGIKAMLGNAEQQKSEATISK